MEGPTTSLADNLLDDLDDLSDVEEEQVKEESEAYELAQQEDIAAADKEPRLLDDPAMQRHLAAIRSSSLMTMTGKEQEEQEYRLIVASNKQLARLAGELVLAHGALCEAYHPKFPELEELLVNPSEYKSAVKAIGNEMDISLVTDQLSQFLNSNQVLTISVSASTTSGRPLTAEELTEVAEEIEYIEEILKVQQELTAYVAERMKGLAPNVCAIVGTAMAAQLMGLAGGLEELSKIPSCNLQVLGQVRQSSASRAGMSSTSTRPNEGILVGCDLVRRLAKAQQKKALKMVAAKVALAARCDYVNAVAGRARDASSGERFRTEIERKFEKWQEPDKAPTLKALPKPDLSIKKRRGGKRIRRLKEKFEETAMMKQANTRAFSAQAGEYGDDAMGLTRGLLDTVDVGAGGALRRKTEKRKMRIANTKASRKRAAQLKAQASGPTNGLATSVVFTPVQGMELVNPEAQRERVQAANRKWFSDSAGFQSALSKKDG